MAQYLGGTWRFYAPQTGWNCFDQAGAQFIFFNGTAWTVMPGGGGTPGDARNIDATGTPPTTATLPDGWLTYRYDPTTDLITLYARNGMTIKALVMGPVA
jgi:hypothetical protein